jgi:hypothetical protein
MDFNQACWMTNAAPTAAATKGIITVSLGMPPMNYYYHQEFHIVSFAFFLRPASFCMLPAEVGGVGVHG